MDHRTIISSTKHCLRCSRSHWQWWPNQSNNYQRSNWYLRRRQRARGQSRRHSNSWRKHPEQGRQHCCQGILSVSTEIEKRLLIRGMIPLGSGGNHSSSTWRMTQLAATVVSSLKNEVSRQDSQDSTQHIQQNCVQEQNRVHWVELGCRRNWNTWCFQLYLIVNWNDWWARKRPCFSERWPKRTSSEPAVGLVPSAGLHVNSKEVSNKLVRKNATSRYIILSWMEEDFDAMSRSGLRVRSQRRRTTER